MFVNKKTYEYQRLAFLSLFSEETAGHLANIEKELKEIGRDNIKRALRSESCQKIVVEIMNGLGEEQVAKETEEKSSKSRRITID